MITKHRFIRNIPYLYVLFSLISISDNGLVLSKKSIVITDNMPCSEIINNTCICNQHCLEPYRVDNNTLPYCKLTKCWKLEDSKCKGTGQNYVTPLVFNIIPLTQPLGIGYASIQRWDLTGIQLAVTFGPFCIFCGGLCGYIMCEMKEKGEDENNLEHDKLNTTIFTQLFQCAHSILLTTFWILSIIDTATPNGIKDGNGCYLTGFD